MRHEIRQPRHFCDLALILPPYLGCDDRVRCRCGLGLALPTFKHTVHGGLQRGGRCAAAAARGPRAGAAARLAACAARVRRAAPAGGGFAGAAARDRAHFAGAGATRGARAAAAHGGRWASRGCGGSPGRVRRSRPADPAPVRLALRTPVCPCCVRAVLVRFVVGVCVLGPLPAARARAVLGLCSFVLGVWCACVAFVYIVRPSHANVVDITGFVVHMCMVKPMPAARAHAVRARAMRVRA